MKRFWEITGIVVGSVMVVVFVVLGLLASDRVETKIAQMATERLSERLGTEVSIGGVAYRFPARVTLSDIYIEDLQRDTLAYIHEVYAHFSPLALRRNEDQRSGGKDI